MQNADKEGFKGFVPKGVSRAKLNFLIFVAALISIMIAEITWLVPSMLSRERQLFQNLEKRALVEVIAAIEESRFEDVARTEKIGKRLISIGDILGGTIYSKLGDRIGDFGQPPVLSWIGIDREGLRRYKDPGWCCLDLHLSPKETGLRDHLVLRLDASNIGKKVWDDLVRLAWDVLIIAIVTCFGIVCLLYFWVVHPIVKLRDVATKVQKNPKEAKNLKLNWSRPDELGELANSMDYLFANISNIYDNELKTARQSMYRTGFAVLHYDPNGSLISANKSAANILGAKSFQELQTLDQNFLRFPNRFNGKPVDIVESLTEGSYVERGSIITSKGDVPCMASGTALTKPDKSVSRYILNIANTKTYSVEIDELNVRLRTLENEMLSMKREWGEMNFISESCSFLINKKKDKSSASSENKNVSAELAINDWIDDANKNHISAEVGWQKGLPDVYGNEQILKAVFRQALTFIYQRSPYKEPSIEISAHGHKTNLVKFEVVDISIRRNDILLPNGQERTNWEVPCSALQNLVYKAGGQILDTNIKPGQPNEVVFVLTLANKKLENAA